MEKQIDKPNASGESCPIMGMMWWTTLAIAVIAVPCLALVVSYIFPFHGIGGLITFVLACWLCTFLGMRLMSNPKMQEKIGRGKK